MSITIRWTVSQLETKVVDGDLENVVVTAHWQCTGVDGEHTGSVYSSAIFSPPDADDFTPYDELDEQTVLGWIWSSGVDRDATEEAVQSQIDTSKNPPIVKLPLPWSNNA